MKPLKIIVIILGSLLTLVGIALFIGGLVLTWAYATQRDDEGYFASSTERFETSTRAITTEDFDIFVGPDTPGWLPDALGEVRLRTENAAREIFVGIGPESDVEAYLAGVEHDEIADVSYDPFEVEYRRAAGGEQPRAPAQQDFWVAQATGAGTQAVTWEVESGHWIAVLMNADGSPGVQADVDVGARSDLLLPVTIGLLLVGLLILLSGAGLILVGAVGIGGAPVAGQAVGEPEARALQTPVRLEGRLDEPLSRWLWLVKWLLAIPHVIVLIFLLIAFALLTFVAGVAILVTGRYPRGIFNFNVGVMRWTWRVGYYAFGAIATDRYPPFSLGPEPDYPATLNVAYPEHLSRGLVLVKWWLLAIPHYLVLAILTAAPFFSWMAWDEGDGWGRGGAGGGLLALLVLIAGIVLLFRGRYPVGLFSLVMGINRWFYRVLAYSGFMTDAYPPFRLDQGGAEPEPNSQPR